MFTIKRYISPFKINVGYSKNDEIMILCYDSGKFILYIGEKNFIVTTDCVSIIGNSIIFNVGCRTVNFDNILKKDIKKVQRVIDNL